MITQVQVLMNGAGYQRYVLGVQGRGSSIPMAMISRILVTQRPRSTGRRLGEGPEQSGLGKLDEGEE